MDTSPQKKSPSVIKNKVVIAPIVLFVIDNKVRVVNEHVVFITASILTSALFIVGTSQIQQKIIIQLK